MARHVFVYGALRTGALHAWRMKDSALLGEASVKGTLVAIDWYPGLVLEGETRVKGEVYEVSDAIIRELDAFEGVGPGDERNGEYRAVVAPVQLDDGREIDCLTYEWCRGVADYEIVENGDWLTRKEGLPPS